MHHVQHHVRCLYILEKLAFSLCIEREAGKKIKEL